MCPPKTSVVAGNDATAETEAIGAVIEEIEAAADSAATPVEAVSAAVASGLPAAVLAAVVVGSVVEDLDLQADLVSAVVAAVSGLPVADSAEVDLDHPVDSAVAAATIAAVVLGR